MGGSHGEPEAEGDAGSEALCRRGQSCNYKENQSEHTASITISIDGEAQLTVSEIANLGCLELCYTHAVCFETERQAVLALMHKVIINHWLARCVPISEFE